jgi:anti-anti-sigma factor
MQKVFAIMKRSRVTFVIAPAGREVFHRKLNSPHPMQIDNLAQGDSHELVVSGRVDGEGANQLEIQLLKAIAAGANKITVELSGVTFLCSAGLRALLQYWRQMQNKGGSLHVSNPSDDAMTLLKTSGFKDMLIQKV